MPDTFILALPWLPAAAWGLRQWRRQAARWQQQVARQQALAARTRQVLAAVQASEPGSCFDDFVALMAHTARAEAPAIRQAALAKLATMADLHGALALLLRSGWHAEAWHYLADNTPPQPQRVLGALREALAFVPADLQARLANHRALHADDYSAELQRLLRVLDRFEPLGLRALPVARALQAALAAPRACRQPLKASALVAQWLEARGEPATRHAGHAGHAGHGNKRNTSALALKRA